MNTSNTQFAVAVLGLLVLGIATVVAVAGEVFGNGRSELTFALVTALTGVTGGATAYLFRLNGRSPPDA